MIQQGNATLGYDARAIGSGGSDIFATFAQSLAKLSTVAASVSKSQEMISFEKDKAPVEDTVKDKEFVLKTIAQLYSVRPSAVEPELASNFVKERSQNRTAPPLPVPVQRRSVSATEPPIDLIPFSNSVNDPTGGSPAMTDIQLPVDPASSGPSLLPPLEGPSTPLIPDLYTLPDASRFY